MKFDGISLHGKERDILFNEILNAELYDFTLHIFLKNLYINKLGGYRDIQRMCNTLARHNGFIVLKDITFLQHNDNDRLTINVSQSVKIEDCMYLKNLTINVVRKPLYGVSIVVDNMYDLESLTIKDKNKAIRYLEVDKVQKLKKIDIPNDIREYSGVLGNSINDYIDNNIKK